MRFYTNRDNKGWHVSDIRRGEPPVLCVSEETASLVCEFTNRLWGDVAQIDAPKPLEVRRSTAR